MNKLLTKVINIFSRVVTIITLLLTTITPTFADGYHTPIDAGLIIDGNLTTSAAVIAIGAFVFGTVLIILSKSIIEKINLARS